MVIFLAIILVLNNLVKCEIAMGLSGPERNGMLEQLGVKMTECGINPYLMGHSDLPGPPLTSTRLPFALRRRGVFAPSRRIRANGFVNVLMKWCTEDGVPRISRGNTYKKAYNKLPATWQNLRCALDNLR